VQVGVVEQDEREGAEAVRPLPADDLVVVELGSSCENAGVFAFSLNCVFQR
jgi:hypothetical protein